LIHKQQFARAANLVGSLGIADTTEDSLKAPRIIFPQPDGISEEVLFDYYGIAAPPNPNCPAVNISIENLRACLAAAPPLPSPHKDI
jgi:hypothetical protein